MISPTTIATLRDALLELHSALLEYQKQIYEEDNQKVTSPAQYFKLVTSDLAFAWLRQVSEVIVSLDEMCDSLENFNPEKAQSLVDYVQQLLNPSSVANDFATKYQKALHADPAVALKHGEVIKLFS